MGTLHSKCIVYHSCPKEHQCNYNPDQIIKIDHHAVSEKIIFVQILLIALIHLCPGETKFFVNSGIEPLCKTSWKFSEMQENPRARIVNTNILSANINHNSPVNSLILLASENSCMNRYSIRVILFLGCRKYFTFYFRFFSLLLAKLLLHKNHI